MIILTALAVVFFFVYSYLNFTTPSLILPLSSAQGGSAWGGEGEEGGGGAIFNSPDETSAYFFSKLFAETGKLSQFESFDFAAPGLIHPRSVLVNSAGYLVPGGFLGMPLIYGSLAKIPLIPPLLKGETEGDFSAMIIPFFTPFFAVLGVLAFYFLIRKIWGENTAFLSAVLAFFLPPFWYYSTRGMFHNVFFAVCLVFSACFFFCLPRITQSTANGSTKGREKIYEYARYCGGGLFLGIALVTRTSEVVWIGILGLALAIYFLTPSSAKGGSLPAEATPQALQAGASGGISPYFRKTETGGEKVGVYWPAAILGFAVLCATFLPVLYQNQMLYGSFFASGYNIPVVQNINQTVESSPSILSPNYIEFTPLDRDHGDRLSNGAGTEQHGNLSPTPSLPLEKGEGEGGGFQRSSVMEKIFSVVQRGKSLLLPFGVHPRAALNNFWNYFIKLFWWFTIPMLLGLLMFFYQICRGVSKIKYDFLSTTHGKSEIRSTKSETNPNDKNSQPKADPPRAENDQNKLFKIFKIGIWNLFGNWKLEIGNFDETIAKNQILYFISFLFISAYLFIYYGSWQILDNINSQKITIGNSYLRYWLPIFIMGLPFVVLFLKNVARHLATALRGVSPKAMICLKMAGDKPPRYVCFLVSLFLCFSVFMSALTVFAGEDEGIFYVKNNLLRYNNIKSEVLNLTPPTPPYSDFSVGTGGVRGGAIIITERSDKIFFPDCRIIVWKRGEALDENFKDLSNVVPLYYYNVAFTGEEFKVFNKELKKMGLKIDLIKLFGNEALYKVY